MISSILFNTYKIDYCGKILLVSAKIMVLLFRILASDLAALSVKNIFKFLGRGGQDSFYFTNFNNWAYIIQYYFVFYQAPNFLVVFIR